MSQSMSSACQKWLEPIALYVDNELDEELCRELEAHLQHCPDCRLYLDSLNKTIRIVHATLREAPVQLPPDLTERLLRVALKQSPSSSAQQAEEEGDT
ncbi:MAG: anti-sigma factor [Chloroflexi bacterium]|nr:anti-sigma factor [Chloroflexota bacterium]